MTREVTEELSAEQAAAESSYVEQHRCLDCGVDVTREPLYGRYRVCPHCRYHYNLPALQRIALLADPGTFRETNQALVPLDPLSFADHVSYRERLSNAQSVTGLLEAVVTGTAYIGGMQTVLSAMDFGFMGGSIGSAVGEKIAQAAELALRQRLPFVLVACGGSPRIREGVLSLMQMAKVLTTLKRLHKKAVPFIAILASPSSSHLLAIAASMADVVLTEPGATIGFAPKKVVEQASDRELPEEFHTAEFYKKHGVIDAIVDRQALKQQLALVLDLLSFRYRLTIANRTRLRHVERPPAPAWERVQLARHEERPTARDYIERITSNFFELHGDRVNADDPGIIIGIGYLAGESVMVIANDRGRGDDAARCREGRLYPEGLRKAERAMRMAARFKLPIVNIIDTPGAYQGIEAEENGIAGAIGSLISLSSDLPTPILAVIIGEGGSEAALALSVADRILMLENAIYTPISPEAAAWLLYRDPERVDQVAAALKLTADDCRSLGIIDHVVPEPEGGAHTNVDEAARQLERMLVQALLDVQMTFSTTMVRNRFRKFRNIGTYSTYLEATLATEVHQFQETVLKSLRELKDRFLGQNRPANRPPDHFPRLPH